VVTKNTGIDSPKPRIKLKDCRARLVAFRRGMVGASRCETMRASIANIAAEASTCSSA
jgi:hypothetical protein